jgi:hypothetical protein
VDRANGVSVLDCEIRGNDMGVMSNGDGTDRTGRDLRIERCRIHHNGDPADPGFNHNLYLGGTSATLRFCEVHSSLTGHNVKSRAHHTRLEWCWIHDSANREIDFVDAADTAAPDSHAVIVGCILAKASPCEGNRETIHFGQDGGKEHDGTLFLVHNTIVSPYVSAVVTLSAPKARCRMAGNLVCDGGAGQKNQVLAAARGGAETKNVTGERNWLSSGFTELGGAMLDPRSTWVGPKDAAPVFVDPAKGDFRLAAPFPGITDAGAPPESIRVPGPPGGPAEIAGAALLAWQYRHPAQGAKRAMKGRPDLGASEGCK